MQETIPSSAPENVDGRYPSPSSISEPSIITASEASRHVRMASPVSPRLSRALAALKKSASRTRGESNARAAASIP